MQIPDNTCPILKGLIEPMLKTDLALKYFLFWFYIFEPILVLLLCFYFEYGVFGVWVGFGSTHFFNDLCLIWIIWKIDWGEQIKVIR